MTKQRIASLKRENLKYIQEDSAMNRSKNNSGNSSKKIAWFVLSLTVCLMALGLLLVAQPADAGAPEGMSGVRVSGHVQAHSQATTGGRVQRFQRDSFHN